MTQLLELDRDLLWHPFTPLAGGDPPILIESASGAVLHTSEGKEIIDAISSWWVNLHGHSNPVIADALAKQARKLEHVIFAGFTHEPAITLAQKLLQILPSSQRRIFYSDNGSTAVEVALKMAFHVWHLRKNPRTKVIALSGAYHGDTFGAMAVGERGLFTEPFKSLLFDVAYIPFPSEANEEMAVGQFEKEVAGGDVAAFIFEPLLQGASGMRIYQPEILDKLLAIARRKQVICIADEVLTGFGRTGKNFACEYLKQQPDIIALSKGLTGGTMPLGVTSASEEICREFYSDDLTRTFFHGHSYTANPLACAAANASFDILMSADCQARILRITEKQAAFAASVKGHSKVSRSQALGTIAAIEIQTPTETSYTNPLRKKILQHFISRGILLRPLGNVIYVLPPYVISEQQLSYVHNEIREFLDLL